MGAHQLPTDAEAQKQRAEQVVSALNQQKQQSSSRGLGAGDQQLVDNLIFQVELYINQLNQWNPQSSSRRRLNETLNKLQRAVRDAAKVLDDLKNSGRISSQTRSDVDPTGILQQESIPDLNMNFGAGAPPAVNPKRPDPRVNLKVPVQQAQNPTQPTGGSVTPIPGGKAKKTGKGTGLKGSGVGTKGTKPMRKPGKNPPTKPGKNAPNKPGNRGTQLKGGTGGTNGGSTGGGTGSDPSDSGAKSSRDQGTQYGGGAGGEGVGGGGGAEDPGGGSSGSGGVGIGGDVGSAAGGWAMPGSVGDVGGAAWADTGSGESSVDASGGDAVVVDDGNAHTVIFTGTDDSSDSEDSSGGGPDDESNGADAGGVSSGGAGGGSSPNPDDGSDESPRMKGLPRRVSRRADAFDNQGLAPAQTSATYRLLAYSSAGLGDDGGGVNPRFFGADPDSDRSTGRAGSGADPDDGGAGQADSGMYSTDVGGLGVGDQGTFGWQGGSTDNVGLGPDSGDVAFNDPSGPDPDNEWGAGGYNPHYQPWGGYVWTPYSRAGAVGTTRVAPVLPARVQRVAAVRFK